MVRIFRRNGKFFIGDREVLHMNHPRSGLPRSHRVQLPENSQNQFTSGPSFSFIGRNNPILTIQYMTFNGIPKTAYAVRYVDNGGRTTLIEKPVLSKNEAATVIQSKVRGMQTRKKPLRNVLSGMNRVMNPRLNAAQMKNLPSELKNIIKSKAAKQIITKLHS